MSSSTISHTEGGPEVLRGKGSMEDGNNEYGSMVVSACDPERKAGSCNGRLEYVLSELTDHAERVGGTPAPSNCPCTGMCRLSAARGKDGPFSECSPKEHYFFVVQDRWAIGSDGEAEWDGLFLPGHHATFEEAFAVVQGGNPNARYVIQEYPRFGMFPPWAGNGGPDAKCERMSDAGMLATVSS